MDSICLISSSLLGPTKNGGVGTAITYLACELEKSGFDVTILFTGGIQCETEGYWIDKYRDMGIKFLFLPTWVKENYWESTVSDHNWWTWRSYWTYQFLLNHAFDIAHFPETCGYAFHTIQAKRTTDLLKGLKVVVTMHSSTEWLKEGMHQFHLEDGHEDRANLLYLKLNYAERYTCRYCDYLLAPSEDMFQWAIRKGWILCRNRAVAFNAYSSSVSAAFCAEIDYDHFIFFGRLEKRKGIDIFCSAMNELFRVKYQNEPDTLKVSFLGKNAQVNGIMATEYIAQNLDAGIVSQIHTDFDTFQALEYIKETSGICVMSSLLDNSPYSIVECIVNKIPFICSDTGGIPELVNEAVLFHITSESLLEKILSIRSIDFNGLKHKYSLFAANSNLVKIHKDIASIEEQGHEIRAGLVSVCIAYKNQSIFILDLLNSIFSNTYTKIEIIIAEEQENSLDRIKIQEMNTMGCPIRYVCNNSHSKGEGYNLCAKEAKGEYLLFIHAEDIMQSDYIRLLVAACQQASLDAVSTLSKKIFGIGNVDLKEKTRNLIMIPFGMNRQLALFENTYTQSSFLISKRAFTEVGGFAKTNDAGIEWQFFNRFCEKGLEMDVAPVVGFRERDIAPELQDKLCYPKKITYLSHENAIEPLLSNMPGYMRSFFYEWALGRYYEEVLTKNAKSRFSYEASAKITYMDMKTYNQKVKNLNGKVTCLEQKTQSLTAQRDNLMTGISNYENSFFWKMTMPMRKILDILKGSGK